MAADELVAVYDAGGAVTGQATRREVRAKGLWHAAGVVLVRSPDGESAYVHRRSPDKDVFPGRYDCWAGGIVAAGETPLETVAIVDGRQEDGSFAAAIGARLFTASAAREDEVAFTWRPEST
jgi:hypothetical protein